MLNTSPVRITLSQRTVLIGAAALIAALCVGCGDRASGNSMTIGGHAIVPDGGMAGISLGMSERAVKRRLGAANDIRAIEVGENGNAASVLMYRTRHLVVQVARGGVTRIETNSRHLRTRDGLRVGSTQNAAVSRLGLSCRRIQSATWCSTSGSHLGDPQTIFVFKGRRVSRVRIVAITP